MKVERHAPWVHWLLLKTHGIPPFCGFAEASARLVHDAQQIALTSPAALQSRPEDFSTELFL